MVIYMCMHMKHRFVLKEVYNNKLPCLLISTKEYTRLILGHCSTVTVTCPSYDIDCMTSIIFPSDRHLFGLQKWRCYNTSSN